jgi:class 3 adenylate cyclase
MDVAEWLATLGLERYAAVFRENDVSAAVVPNLTAEDLKDLGIRSVGHRRQLLDAIAELRTKAKPADEQVGLLAEPSTFRSAEATAERRQLTVMFCDLVGSTALSARLDPEDLRAIIGAHQAEVAKTATRFGGFVAKYLGDGVLVYFGWPRADETDAERAVLAALAITGAVTHTQTHDEPLAVRIGIATGVTVVGDLLGQGAAQEQAVVGETPNVAARLQSAAEPGTVLIDPATHHLIGGFFTCRDLGAVALKGLPEPVRIFQVEGEAAVEGRFAARRETGLTPLVGRDEELELILRRWRQVKAGEGQVVLLSGEPGIGKSRLIADLEDHLTAEPHVSLRYFCSPHHQESALHPIIARWEQEAGFARGDTPEDRLRKLEAALAPSRTSAEDLVLIADLLSVPIGDRYPVPDLSPQRKREKTFETLNRRLVSRARRQPVLMVFEDAHWADPSSLELLDMAISAIGDLPILAVISFRPEFPASWIGQAAVSLITLRRLSRRLSAQLASEVKPDHVLPPALLKRIVAQTDGVPLFIEELTKTMLEIADQRDGVAPALTVPASLQALLMARLDRLQAAKQVAQIGAVIGREFPYGLLAAVARFPEEQLMHGLDELVASGLAFRRGLPPDAVYTFKHALVQDAAYEGLLRSRRAEIHANIAGVMACDAETVAHQPILLGYHCAQAGLIEKAATYYRRAGDQSEARSAYAETKTLLDRGLTLAATLPDSPGRRLLETELWATLGRILSMTKGFGDGEALIAIGRGIDLSRTLDSIEPLTYGLRDRALNFLLRGDHERGWRDAQELLSVAETTRDTRAHIFGHLTRGNLQLARGRFADARADYETALELCSRESNEVFDAVHWVKSMRFFSAFSLACLGHVDQAAAEVARLIEEVRQDPPFARAVALSHLCRFAPHSSPHFCRA